MLPAPPDDTEKYSRVHRNMTLMLSILIIGPSFVIASQVLLECYRGFALPFLVITVYYGLYQLLGLFVNFSGHSFDLVAHREKVCRWQPERYPSIDIYLPVCGEPEELLANTWRAIRAMTIAYPGRAVPYVLDDSPTPGCADLAASFGFTRITRPDRTFNKAGNLRHAYAMTDGEFYAVFDADFAPRADFLEELLPYFDDPQTAVVQTPQYFRSYDGQPWVERGAGALQEIFFRAIQVTRNTFGASMCVGSNVIYRRAALDHCGGIPEVSYAEDVHTGLEAIRGGGKVVYLPVVLAAGICPEDVNAYARQQYRWAAGTLSVGFTRRMWTAPMSLRAKLAYFSGSLYNIYSALSVMITPLLPLTILSAKPELVKAGNWLILLPALIAGFALFPAWHMNDYRLRDALPMLMLRGWSNALAIWDYSRGKIMAWQPTGSKVSPLKRLWWSMRVWNLAAAVGWTTLGVWRIWQTGSLRFVILTLFGVLNIVIVVRLLAAERSTRNKGTRGRHGAGHRTLTGRTPSAWLSGLRRNIRTAPDSTYG